MRRRTSRWSGARVERDGDVLPNPGRSRRPARPVPTAGAQSARTGGSHAVELEVLQFLDPVLDVTAGTADLPVEEARRLTHVCHDEARVVS